MTQKALKTGKLDLEILRNLLKRYPLADEKVILGPGIGEDAAAIDMGDRILVVTTDPITFATDEIGYYSVMVNANDIATSGAEPKWYTVTILLPEGQANENLVDSIFQQIHSACKRLGISIIGGHTEITYGLDRPVLVGQMMGLVERDALITTSGAEPGDTILLTQGICIEGTSIIAREREKELLHKGISPDLIRRARQFLFDPGICVVEDAGLAARAGRVHAMHDITEGGLANGLYELSMAAGIQIEVETELIPIFKESRILCDALHLNPLGVISSGSLLIAAAPSDAEIILDSADQHSAVMTRIGRVKAAGPPSVTIVTAGGRKPFPYFDRDEIAKIY